MKKKFELLDIPINWIHPSEDNPRKTKDEDELQQLIESIRENGLLEEISINRVGQNLFEIIDGERRFDAIKALEWDTVRCKVYGISAWEAQLIRLIVALMKSNIPDRQLEDALYELFIKLLELKVIVPDSHLTGAAEDRGILSFAKMIGVHRESLRAYLNAAERRSRKTSFSGFDVDKLTHKDFYIAESLEKLAPEQYIQVLKRRAEGDLTGTQMTDIVKAIKETSTDLWAAVATGEITTKTARQLTKIESEAERKKFLDEAIEIEVAYKEEREEFSDIVEVVVKGEKKKTKRQKKSELDLMLKDSRILKEFQDLRNDAKTLILIDYLEEVDDEEKRRKCYSYVNDIWTYCDSALVTGKAINRPMIVGVDEVNE